MFWDRKNIIFIGKCIIIGAAAGIAAVAYRAALTEAEILREGLFHFADSPLHVIMLFAFLLLFGLITGRITESEPMIKGSGIPQMEGQFYGHFSPKPLPVLVKKFIGGTLSIICGLSLGREGPSIQLGAMSGQLVGDHLHNNEEDNKLLLLCGACAGLSAAFNAPLAGVAFAIEETYKKEPLAVVFTPYRICPIGAHSDHNLGKITGLAIDKGIYMAYGPKQNGIVEMTSLQFNRRAQFHVNATPEVKQNDWADCLRGATRALAQKYNLKIGMCGVIDGELPIGGLSSSAAVIITYLMALCRLNGIQLSEAEMIRTAQEAENNYVGVSCGKLDQSCEVYCKKLHLLYMDMQDDSYELIPTNPAMKPYKIAIFFSGIERTLAGSKYNMRVDECRSAAYALKAYAGMEYGKFQETNLREVPYEVYLQYRDRLPENWAKRAQHWYEEFDRVQRGAEAWRKGDLEEFGRLSFESGYSSIYNWETGSPELKTIYEIMTRTKGIYGGRFSGAGFKGCCVALIDPAYEADICEKVTAEYLKAFPKLEGKYSVHICESADGARF